MGQTTEVSGLVLDFIEQTKEHITDRSLGILYFWVPSSSVLTERVKR